MIKCWKWTMKTCCFNSLAIALYFATNHYAKIAILRFSSSNHSFRLFSPRGWFSEFLQGIFQVSIFVDDLKIHLEFLKTELPSLRTALMNFAFWTIKMFLTKKSPKLLISKSALNFYNFFWIIVAVVENSSLFAFSFLLILFSSFPPTIPFLFLARNTSDLKFRFLSIAKFRD